MLLVKIALLLELGTFWRASAVDLVPALVNRSYDCGAEASEEIKSEVPDDILPDTGNDQGNTGTCTFHAATNLLTAHYNAIQKASQNASQNVSKKRYFPVALDTTDLILLTGSHLESDTKLITSLLAVQKKGELGINRAHVSVATLNSVFARQDELGLDCRDDSVPSLELYRLFDEVDEIADLDRRTTIQESELRRKIYERALLRDAGFVSNTSYPELLRSAKEVAKNEVEALFSKKYLKQAERVAEHSGRVSVPPFNIEVFAPQQQELSKLPRSALKGAIKESARATAEYIQKHFKLGAMQQQPLGISVCWSGIDENGNCLGGHACVVKGLRQITCSDPSTGKKATMTFVAIRNSWDWLKGKEARGDKLYPLPEIAPLIFEIAKVNPCGAPNVPCGPDLQISGNVSRAVKRLSQEGSLRRFTRSLDPNVLLKEVKANSKLITDLSDGDRKAVLTHIAKADHAATAISNSGTVLSPQDISLLLREKADGINYQDASGRTMLMHFVSGDRAAHDFVDFNEEVANVRKIIKLRRLNPNLKDSMGNTALHLSVGPQDFSSDTLPYENRAEMITLLLKNSANPSLRNKEGLSPLDLVLRKEDDSSRNNLVRAFVTSGKIDMFDELTHAIQRKDLDIISKLASPIAQDPQFKDSHAIRAISLALKSNDAGTLVKTLRFVLDWKPKDKWSKALRTAATSAFQEASRMANSQQPGSQPASR